MTRQKLAAVIALTVLPTVFFSGCATPVRSSSSVVASTPIPKAPLAALLGADVVLLGEVHDNAGQHAIRSRWLRELAAQRRFALVIEQLDTAMQAQIDTALADGVSARQLAERAGFRFEGWQWPFYESYIDMAIESRLPLAGANLAAAELMAIARGQRPRPTLLDAQGVDWREADQSVMLRAIDEGHCGKMPAQALDRMVVAQRVRDAGMAQAIVDTHRRTGLPIVLLAGNGHVRNDIGVPRYLRAAWPGARIVTIGFEEAADAAIGATARRTDAGDSKASVVSGRYDELIVTAAQPRPDPCAVFERKPASTLTPSTPAAGSRGG